MKVLLIFAHPDDETFTSSGTIIHLTKKGCEAKLIMATRGEAGLLGKTAATRQSLGSVREQELRRAAKITGISDIYFLDYIDGTLIKTSSAEIKSKILPILKKEEPDLVITFEKNGISMHPDHKVISQVATESFYEYMESAKNKARLYHVCVPSTHIKIHHDAGFKYEHFGKMEGTPDDEITTRVDITDVYPRKVQAMKCHETQKKDYGNLLKRNELIPGKKYEYFKLIAESDMA